jgi:L-cysteine S-thiosulfotransferase
VPRRLESLLPTALVGLLLSGALAGAEPIPRAERRSGFDQMSPEIQAMQRDDGANPGMLAVADGEDLWTKAPPSGRPACAGCHGEASSTMRGVATRYPAWDAQTQEPVDLQTRVNTCRRQHQGVEPLAYESPDLLALTAFIAAQSRGLPMTPPDDTRLDPARAEGRLLFEARQGQLGLSCAVCHDDHWGRRLGAAVIPQGQPTGYPLYRLEWQGLGSLQRRLRNCLTGMRAEPFAYGAPEYIALELYLATRATPLPIETPAVRP